MAKNAPGQFERNGLTLLEIADMFNTEEKARKWLEDIRWKDGVYCPHCGSFNVQSNIKHKTMTHRCRDCPKKKMFSVRTGTVMEGSKIKLRVWAIGLYLYSTNIKGVSSMRLHRELGITQKSAWFMLHRLREASDNGLTVFEGPVEVDETYMGGKRKNMSNEKRKELADTGRGAVGKVAVVGMKDRETNQVNVKVVKDTKKETLQNFVVENTKEDTVVYTDEAKAYEGVDRKHEAVKHSISQYVKDQAHTNGIESFWSLLKRGYTGIYHKMSHKHLDRYVYEFGQRYNVRKWDTIHQMEYVVENMKGKRLKYKKLIEDNGLDSGARC